MGGLIFAGVIVGLFGLVAGVNVLVDAHRVAFIKGYEFPSAVVDGIREDHPEIDAAALPLVVDALRQWLLVARKSEGTPLAMPSRAADDAWHRFILATRPYHRFCEKAYGHYLDHTPNAVAAKVDPDAIPRTLVALDKLHGEAVDDLPLLFAVDRLVRCDRARVWDRHTLQHDLAECSTGELPERDSGGCCA